MKKINFVTSNPKKVASLQRRLDELNLDIEVIQQDIELIEMQANSVKEVSIF